MTNQLKSYFTEALQLHMKTKIKKMKLNIGIKDTFQLYYITNIFNSYKSKQGTTAKQATLNTHLASLPKNTTSPVWRIKGTAILIQTLTMMHWLQYQGWMHTGILLLKYSMLSFLDLWSTCGETWSRIRLARMMWKRSFSSLASPHLMSQGSQFHLLLDAHWFSIVDHWLAVTSEQLHKQCHLLHMTLYPLSALRLGLLYQNSFHSSGSLQLMTLNPTVQVYCPNLILVILLTLH